MIVIDFTSVMLLSLFWTLLTTSAADGLRILESTLPLSDYGNSLSGARLTNGGLFESQDITFCVRFNAKKLGIYEGAGRIFGIEDYDRDRGEDGGVSNCSFRKRLYT